jgi:predicted esterase
MKSYVMILLCLVSGPIQAQETGYQKEVKVHQATRLDWIFAMSNQSLAVAPADWLPDYDSTQQRYELFVPRAVKGTRKPAAKSTSRSKTGPTKSGAELPLILFISAGDQPAGWGQLQAVCEQQGFAFASPYGAGNNTPMPQRVRIVLDVLDDIRQRHAIDPDRTYLAGFSGGGRTACGIAFALPELFGGVIPVCAGGDLREETWLRHRVIDRLSVALVTGTGDFNLSEVSRFRGPMLTDMGVRTQVTVVDKLGHGIPDSQTFTKVVEWLDAGAPDRRKLAASKPASRISGDAAPAREQWAKSLLAEGQSQLKKPETLFTGLMLLQGTMQRWPDLPQAADAKRILLEYEAQAEHPWEADDIAEQRKFLIARARALSDYATGDLPEQYARQRSAMLEAAINLWTMIVQDGQDRKAVAEGEKLLPILKERLEKEPVSK